MGTDHTDRVSRKARTLALLLGGLGLFCGGASLAQGPPPAPAGLGNSSGQTAPQQPLGQWQAQPDAAPAAEDAAQDDPSCETQQTVCCEEDEEPECRCLMTLFADDCGNNWVADAGLDIYGFAAVGTQWNPDSPDNNINGPVTFADRANTAQLNQLYLIFESAIDRDAEEWQVGGRMDVLYGTDYFFTQALGLELEQNGTQRWNDESTMNRANASQGGWYGLAMPQLYGEVGGYGWSVKAGHFYTIIGYEVVPATGNFFYTHAYTMQYGEPFTHTGVLASYDLGDNVTVSSGVVQGWDNWDNTNPGVSYLGGVTWTNTDENVTLAASVITGEEPVVNVTEPTPGQFVNVRNFRPRTMYSLVATLLLTEDLTYVLHHDNGWQNDAGGIGGDDAEWYGVNQYLFYQMTDNLRAGLRGEWFRDDDGFRLANGAMDYYEVTAGLNWHPNGNACLLVRPEVRYDWSEGGNAYGDFLPGTRTFSDDDQFLFATDVVYQF